MGASIFFQTPDPRKIRRIGDVTPGALHQGPAAVARLTGNTCVFQSSATHRQLIVEFTTLRTGLPVRTFPPGHNASVIARRRIGPTNSLAERRTLNGFGGQSPAAAGASQIVAPSTAATAAGKRWRRQTFHKREIFRFLSKSSNVALN